MLSPRAPVDIVTANRSAPTEGDNTVDLPLVFRGRLPDPFHQLMVDAQVAAAPDCETVLAVGGGRAIDLGKYLAWKRGRRPVG